VPISDTLDRLAKRLATDAENAADRRQRGRHPANAASPPGEQELPRFTRRTALTSVVGFAALLAFGGSSNGLRGAARLRPQGVCDDQLAGCILAMNMAGVKELRDCLLEAVIPLPEHAFVPIEALHIATSLICVEKAVTSSQKERDDCDNNYQECLDDGNPPATTLPPPTTSPPPTTPPSPPSTGCPEGYEYCPAAYSCLDPNTFVCCDTPALYCSVGEICCETGTCASPSVGCQ
jgi:hypothetical protein